MNKMLIIVLSAIVGVAHAGQRAVTDEGAVVILNDDGTWQYESNEAPLKKVIRTNDAKFTKHSDHSFQVKSTRNDASFWIDPKKWSFKKNEGDSAAEYNFQLKGNDLYGMAITESIEVDLENLAAIAFSNAKDAAPDAKVISQEYRTVNGKKVLHMQINGTIQGIKFTYLGYYFSSENGATQFITYTATPLVKKYKNEIENFLNGLMITD